MTGVVLPIEPAVRDRIAETLNKVPLVRWDRMVATETSIQVYGWIARDDRHADFFILDFDLTGAWSWYTTSSARHERECVAGLEGREIAEDEGFACQRVEDVCGDLVEGAIRLSRPQCACGAGCDDGVCTLEEEGWTFPHGPWWGVCLANPSGVIQADDDGLPMVFSEPAMAARWLMAKPNPVRDLAA